MEDRDEQLIRLAAEALRTPAAQRETFLRAACRQDSNLYSEVTEMVEWEERMGGFMRDPLVGMIDLEELDRPFQPHQVVAERFEIIREVGDGGMGVVYEAYDRKRQQRIAIKCAKLGYERLSPELRGALKVRHPNVCLVNEIHTASTDLGELDFLTMEFLDGETLLSRLSRGKLEPDEALTLARQLCAGLAEAHRSGVLHRDLKPANVILSSEKAKALRAVITDFGLAADQDGNTDLIGGTPSYMAPELKQSGQTSPASDVYALGVILYEMVTGRKPFPETAASNGDAPTLEPLAPGKLVRHLPRMWNDAILPCLAPRPEERPSAEQILAVLDRKPLFRRPWVPVAALVLITVGALSWRPIYEYFRTPDIRLAILPTQGIEELPSMGDRYLREVAQRLAGETKGKLKFKMILLANADSAGQAESLLHATHALHLMLRREGDVVVVEAAVVDAKTLAHIREYAGRFARGDLSDLPGGLAGLVSAALHLPRAAPPDAVLPAATAAYASGRNHLRQGRYSYEQAIAQFQEAHRLDPHSPLPLAGLAEAYMAKYNVERNEPALDDAKVYLRSAEQLDPDSPQVRIASAALNIASGKYAQALDDCRRALEVDPGIAEAWLYYGFAYEMQGIPDKPLEAYHKAIEIDPLYYKPYQYLGGFYYYRGKFAEAEQQYRKEVERAVDDQDGFSDLGAALTEQGRYDEAEGAYAKALQIKPTPSNLNNLGVTLTYLRRDAQALQLYQQAVKLEPANHLYWINIGDAQRRLGHAKAAKAAYKEALNLTLRRIVKNPSSGSIRAFMAYAEARLGHKADAQNEIGQALQSSANDNQLLRTAVSTYEALEMRGLALKVAARATPEARISLEHHPDLAGLSRDSRFRQLMAQSK